ncbi:Nuclear factor of activated T-cells, cytoplasmic 3 [Oryzias melastigma]|uniref:Nuclear factor of activated T cells 3b n=1 Tax=Oryzias melastigma TaxID=30732 RepID=A0A3B3CP89_ORYME|nr:nuclear factor of activated T-cells, cytoplasmic 3 [Oryzias melastigma]KAF6716314.1 Nuclear factor of activated T-cells, cytoplasmic 3 [Oryzias melastigma]
MSAVNCFEELDFRLIFEEDGRQAAAPDLGVKTPPASTQGLAEQLQDLQDYPPCLPAGSSYHNADYQAQDPCYGLQETARAFDCPSIQITSITHNNPVESASSHELFAMGGAEGGYIEPSWPRGQLYLPLDPSYRDTTLCPSPCSSLSSKSWVSDFSSCESFSHVSDDVEGDLSDAALLAIGSPAGSPLGSPGCGGGAFGVELWQQQYQHPSAFSPSLSPQQSPSHSPRASVTEDSWLNCRPNSRPSSRPSSPCGKRRHSGADPHTRSPSPHHSASPTPGTSPRGSVTDDTWLARPFPLGPPLTFGYPELDVPSKTRRKTGNQFGLLNSAGDAVVESYQDPPGEDGREQQGIAELFLKVPSHFSWNKPKPGNPPLFRTVSPPPLDFPLPSHYEQMELKLEVQPRSYHRAHYETEGSRGSIKAATGGHPVITLSGYQEHPVSLLLFIGTADDRHLRPHSFYQVHRVTGKTVSTICQEKVMGGTKVLEIHLLPEKSMSASIDCAGILKLRNADIELKKGETDIGRKNTRVRVVFRAALPQQDDWMLWLQTASNPVECSQRSGQELPQVDSFSPASCPVDGGEELLITGSNISAQSRVFFTERGPDGRSLWEMEARLVSEKCNESSIVAEIPPYSKKAACPVHVQFYVTNGKRRKSLMQSFAYVAGVRRQHPGVKEEGSYAAAALHAARAQTSCQDPDLQPDLGCFAPHDLLMHCHPSSSPRLHHLPPSSHPLESFMFPLSAPHQTSAPFQTMTMPPPHLTIPPLITSLSAASSGPLQTAPHHPSPGESLNSTFMSIGGTFKPAAGCQKTPPLPGSADVLRIKQEPEDRASPKSLGLQEITLDDVNEIIDRDFSALSGCVEPNL